MELVELWTACNCCAGFCVILSLGNRFFSQGLEQVDSEILPEFTTSAAEGISPRVLSSYAILFWCALQVSDTVSNSYSVVGLCTCIHTSVENGKSLPCWIHIAGTNVVRIANT